jgi:hypothetical protein
LIIQTSSRYEYISNSKQAVVDAIDLAVHNGGDRMRVIRQSIGTKHIFPVTRRKSGTPKRNHDFGSDESSAHLSPGYTAHLHGELLQMPQPAIPIHLQLAGL